MKVLNMYSSNNKTSKHMKEKIIELKAEINKYIITAGDLNYSLVID